SLKPGYSAHPYMTAEGYIWALRFEDGASRIAPSRMPYSRSAALFAEATRYIPGGVNSPVRAFRGVGGEPFFVERAAGAYIWDADGNRYIDYVGTWGPAILGHAPQSVLEAIAAAAQNGVSFGIPN